MKSTFREGKFKVGDFVIAWDSKGEAAAVVIEVNPHSLHPYRVGGWWGPHHDLLWDAWLPAWQLIHDIQAG